MQSPTDVGIDFEQEELKGFSRSLAEIEWLVLILVLLYLVVPGTRVDDRQGVLLALGAFGAFTVAFHYINFYRVPKRWKLALETWAMIAFITSVLTWTGGVDSPLLNLYLLAIIASALTLGRLHTLLEVGLVGACFFWLGYRGEELDILSLAYFGRLMGQLSPFLLVGYLTTMLASDIHAARNKIRALADTDELTRLMNMRGFSRILRREYDQAVRYARSFALLMVDVDNIRAINNQYGNEAGNRLLRTVATVLASTVRATDSVARYGGDEFVVLMVETGRRQALETAERIRRAVARSSVLVDGHRLFPGVTTGMACYPYDGTEVRELMDAAARSLATAKMESRDA